MSAPGQNPKLPAVHAEFAVISKSDGRDGNFVPGVDVCAFVATSDPNQRPPTCICRRIAAVGQQSILSPFFF